MILPSCKGYDELSQVIFNFLSILTVYYITLSPININYSKSHMISVIDLIFQSNKIAFVKYRSFIIQS